ncbi:dipeptide ABC transporter ATP-binding protein [Cryptosporangium aurantiacum]|uniref:Peptide/nickel transport system ATP-binding protein n=1 Tax=Cryptosporangium aurantiacum TaxID=134849 RepID=A0A1M7KB01_9ACTN|nr:ABC transporter ATP-binding protein [Cryptosporangium aurantiacum]SHM62408.1 peptide/nickel transport system ATP-binding protein [Cryptosporangium aurantiacum]
MATFEVENLRVRFGDTEAVRGVSFAVDAGQTLAIVGESGSGKSVSLLAATGLLGGAGEVTGSARLDGTELVGASPGALRRLRGKDIGFVFQDPLANLHPLKTIGKQVGEAITAHERVRRTVLRRRVVELLDEVGIREPHRRVDDYPVHFSGGMRQRAMIAAAIALNPKLLIADEATTALDVTVQASILELLQRLQREHGSALVFVSHDLGVVSDIADDIVVLRNGEVVEAGAADEIYAAPAHPYTVELLSATRHKAVTPKKEDRPVLLEARNLTQRYTSRKRSVTAVDDVSFDVGAGEILGVVGESGSGKSTIGRIVSGLLKPTAGTVALGGEPYAAGVPAALRPRIQVVFQDPYASLNPRRTIRAILAEPYVIHQRPTPDLGEAVRRVDLPVDVLDRYPAQLSGGQRQRVAIARAIALEPDLVVADEPVSSLDVTTQAQILALLRRLRDELDVSFLFISHDLGVVADLCDRVLVLSEGRVVEDGITSEVFAAPSDPYTQRLLDAIPGRKRGLLHV